MKAVNTSAQILGELDPGARNALLLFSGGVDSTYTAARSAPDYDRLVLLTYQVPGMVNVEASTRSSAQLIRVFGRRFSHLILDIRDFVMARRGGVGQCLRDNLRYRFHYSWCLGCKMSMHLHTIELCHRYGITTVLDGSNEYDLHALEQYRDVKEWITRIYDSAGIHFSSPHYTDQAVSHSRGLLNTILKHLALLHDSTGPRVAWLRARGIDMGRGFLSQYRKTQPSCVMSLPFNALRVPLKLLWPEVRGEEGGGVGYLGYLADRFQAGAPSTLPLHFRPGPGAADHSGSGNHP
ncbi:MAG: hypothetical protein ACOX9B_00220 [Candidatus Xenobium sp.]|nr:hypothetical protein [Burkholderiales bacterium]